MKKFLATVCTLLLAVGVLAGCGGAGGGETKPQGGESTGKTFTIGLQQNTLVEDYDNNGFTNYIKEVSGSDIEFIYFASNSNDAKSQLSTRIAGGEALPDILWGFELGTEVYTEYGRDGYLVDMKDYFFNEDGSHNDKAKNFWDMLESGPYSADQQATAIRRMTDQGTGAMYVLPRLEESPVDTMDYCPYINVKWLDKLGLQMPTNADELYNVLKAFKEQDPNGNGRADEIPLTGANSSINGMIVEWIINMFTYYNSHYLFSVDDNGKLFLPQLTPEFREGLKFINKLYEEGLMYSGSLTAGRAELTAINTPADGTALAGIFVGHLTLHVEIDNEVLYDYKPLPFWSNCIRKEEAYSLNTFITSDCEDPEGAFEFLMNFYTKDAALRERYGEYGVDWVGADEGSFSYIGKPAEIKVLNEGAFGAQTSTTWSKIACTILYDAEGEISQLDNSAGDWTLYKREIFSDMVKNFKEWEAKTPAEKSCGVLVYSEEEKEETEMVRSNCGNKISTAISSFIVGTTKGFDIENDADWAKFAQDLKDLEIDTYLELAQKVYDRQK